jgi:hypothetical protein
MSRFEENPKAARSKCLSAFNSVLTAIITNPSDRNAWNKYFVFTFECLRKPIRGTKISLASFVNKNIDAFLLKEDVSQKLPIKKKVRQKKETDSLKRLKNVVCEKIDMGNISGAMRMLLADDSIAPDNTETFANLLEKHPARTADRISLGSNSAPPQSEIEISHEVLIKCIQSFPPDSSAGIDGLRPQHVKEMYLGATDTNTLSLNLNPLVSFCNLIFNGKLPDLIRPLFFGARLIALNKKDGGIRPIAVGNTIRRILSKFACHIVKSKISTQLHPHQTGFSTKNGSEAAIHATRNYIENQPNKAFLKIDFKNAFNCVRRDIFLREVQNRCPEIFNYIFSSYECNSILAFNDKSIFSQEGVQQGDPIGPMLFCVAIQSIIHQITTELNIWYLDDGIIGDNLDNVMSNFEMIVEESRKIGLTVNSAKCELFIGEKCPQTAMQRNDIRILKTNELHLLGSSLNVETMQHSIESKMQDLQTIFNKLSILPSHYAFHVLKNCYSTPKLIYLLRTAPCFKLSLLNDVDSLIQKATREMTNINITDSALKQAMLPCRNGGIGIRNATELAVPAYLSSVLTSEDLASALNPLFSRGSQFEEGHQTWKIQTNLEWPPHPKFQKSWDLELVKIKCQELLDKETDTYHQKRLQSLKNDYASDWLNAVPSKPIGTFLNDEELRAALCLRLGLPFAEEHACKCGATTDRLGRHCFSCKKNPGKSLRHSAVNSILSKNLQAMGMQNLLEPSNLFQANGLRPDGVTLLPYKAGKSLIWDFTCPHPLCQSHLSRIKVTDGAEDRKREKYRNMSDNYHFVPIAIDTLGGYGKQAKQFVNYVGQKIGEKQNDPRRKAFLRQNIAIAIQRGNAKTMLFSIY